MYNISPLPFTPDQRLDPPYIERADHDWAAVFRCHIGDEGLKVKVVCEVTCADEIDPGSIVVYLEANEAGFRRDIDLTNILNDGLRDDITKYFERHFDEIYDANHE